MSLEINKLFTVKDRVVLVTGGGKGVGEMVCQQLETPAEGGRESLISIDWELA